MSDEQLLQRLQNQALEDRQEPERRDSIESQDSDAVSFFLLTVAVSLPHSAAGLGRTGHEHGFLPLPQNRVCECWQ
jgi:hypothetical protein